MINSRKTVLVDFYAEWCIPCKRIPTILKEVKKALKGDVHIIKVDVDKHPWIASRYSIKKLPTILLFRNGEVKWTGWNIENAEQIKEIIREHGGTGIVNSE